MRLFPSLMKKPTMLQCALCWHQYLGENMNDDEFGRAAGSVLSDSGLGGDVPRRCIVANEEANFFRIVCQG